MKYIKFFILPLIIVVICWGNIAWRHPYMEVSPELVYRIKKLLIKNYTLSKVYDLRSQLAISGDRRPGEGIARLFNAFSENYYGFGYMPGEPDMSITPLNWPYPNKKYKLYKVRFLETTVNDTLASWYSYKRYLKLDDLFSPTSGAIENLIVPGSTIVAVNKKQEIRIISGGMGFGHQIADDFQLNPQKPETYLPFLKLKLYVPYLSEGSKISFSRKENGKLIFLIDHVSGAQSEYRLDPEYPDKLVATKYLRTAPRDAKMPSYNSLDTFVNPYKRYRIPLSFPTLADKELYLKDALMRNLYMYRLHQLDNLAERMNLDTIAGCLRGNSSDVDELLPDFDEYLGQIALYKRYCCFSPQSPRCVFNCTAPIYESMEYLDGNSRKVVGEAADMYRYVELFAFIKSKKEVLFKRPGSFYSVKKHLESQWQPSNYKEAQLWYRYDMYYHAAMVKETKLPAPIDADKWYTNCYQNSPIRTIYDDLPEPADFYLLALDTKTREVYFLSGEDIYLSAATGLYQYGAHPYRTNINFQTNEPLEWKLNMKLCYIRDRLHQYLIENLTKDNIIEMNDKKIIVEVTGRAFPFRPKPYRVRATFYEDRPELLDVEVLE